MLWSDQRVLNLALFLRPVMRRRVPLVHELCKAVAAWACPKGAPGKGRHLVAPYGQGSIHIDTSRSVDYRLLFHGCHEPLVVDAIRRMVKPGAVCLDVGANIGTHTLVMAWATGPSGRVIAVEPHPRMAARLRENVALNRLGHVTVVEAALSDHDGPVSFHAVPADASRTGISSLQPVAEGTTEKIEVQAISGLTLVREAPLPTCDFIKIDVEGHETIVIDQLRPILEQHRPILIFEYRKRHWDRHGGNVETVLDLLRRLDYEFCAVGKHGIRAVTDTVPESGEILAIPSSAAPELRRVLGVRG